MKTRYQFFSPGPELGAPIVARFAFSASEAMPGIPAGISSLQPWVLDGARAGFGSANLSLGEHTKDEWLEDGTDKIREKVNMLICIGIWMFYNGLDNDTLNIYYRPDVVGHVSRLS
jgi:hypothetical protein